MYLHYNVSFSLDFKIGQKCDCVSAYNPKSSEYVRKKYKKKLMQFEETCELIKYLGDHMTKRYKEPRDRPIDFDFKMEKFIAIKDWAPQATADTWVS